MTLGALFLNAKSYVEIEENNFVDLNTLETLKTKTATGNENADCIKAVFIPITRGGKKSTNQDQTNCTSKEQFQPIVTGCLFFSRKLSPRLQTGSRVQA